jgi:Domain of unknown function (DUF1707)
MADPSEGSVRVSDEQRERAAQEIREHYAAGRLNDDELDNRVQAAYKAQTKDELQRVRADLPVLPPTQQELRAQHVQRRSELQRRLLQQTGGGAALFALCTVIWVAAGASGMFWPVWVALVALIPLIRNGWRLYGPAPELDRVEEELAARERGSRRPGRPAIGGGDRPAIGGGDPRAAAREHLDARRELRRGRRP